MTSRPTCAAPSVRGTDAFAVDYWFATALSQWAALKFADRPRWNGGVGEHEGTVAHVETEVSDLEHLLAADLSATRSKMRQRDRTGILVVRGAAGLMVACCVPADLIGLTFGDTVTVVLE